MSWKITFLLAVTSAKRAGELQAFGSSDPYIVLLWDKALLRFLPTFRPKILSLANINQITLPVLSSDRSSQKDMAWRSLDGQVSQNIFRKKEG